MQEIQNLEKNVFFSVLVLFEESKKQNLNPESPKSEVWRFETRMRH
jgi:hypothetical protein